MGGPIWTIVLSLLPKPAPHFGRFTFNARTILMVGLRAIMHDRPFRRACHAAHWPRSLRPPGLPHPSTFSCRWRSGPIQQERARMQQRVQQRLPRRGRLAAIDGRPLMVGGASKDRQAKAGRAIGGFARGYKFHTLMDETGAFVCFQVHSMNIAEQTVAQSLLKEAPPRLKRILGDEIHDSIPLHRVAHATRRRLYTPLRQGRVGRRRQPQRLRLCSVYFSTARCGSYSAGASRSNKPLRS